jgi:hypothetical protein
MNTNSGGDDAGKTVRVLLEQFQQVSAAGSGSADRLRRDQLLDELQDLVGLSGRTVTENDIVRRAQAMSSRT